MALRRMRDEETGEVVDVEIADSYEPTPDEWAKLRNETKARNKAEADLAAQRKENAFLRIGLDLEQPAISDFYKAYDGDLTADAIRAAATARGYLSPPAPVDEQQVPDSGSDPDQAAHQAAQRIASAAAGATPDLRSDTAKMADAHADGGSAAVTDFLRERGFAIADTDR